MPRHWVYMLLCSDGTLYSGSTTDHLRRLREHNRGTASKYTRGRLPVKLAYLEECASKSAALKREAALKRLDRRTKLQLCAGFRSTSHS